MSFREWRDTKQKVSMSEKVGRIIEFLKDTACVHVQERRVIAHAQNFMLMFPNSTLKPFLEDKAVPMFIRLGQAKWYRDTITDLGLALSQKERAKQSEDAKDILETEIE